MKHSISNESSMKTKQSSKSDKKTLDSYEDIYVLQREYFADTFIRDWYMQSHLDDRSRSLAPLYSSMHVVDDINNQFAKKITPILLNPNVKSSLALFRELIPNTIDEEMLLLINDTQYIQLHNELSQYMVDKDQEIVQEVEANLIEIKKADAYQFKTPLHNKRDLDGMLSEGMNIKILDSGLDAISKAFELSRGGILPITEYLKNDKILSVNGFNHAKISLAIHDFIDHVWTFDMLRRSGLLDKYRDLFNSIGSPDLTDIFKREGEVVASIAFGVRYFQTMPATFQPTCLPSEIERILDTHLISGDFEDRHFDAYRIVKSLKHHSMEMQSLSFVFSNYLTELDEQRRKFGTIKQRIEGQKIKELDPFSVDYLCFFIEAHREIISSKHKHRNDLLRFHILLEEYILSCATDPQKVNHPWNLTLESLRSSDLTETLLPPMRIRWMSHNYGFTASKALVI